MVKTIYMVFNIIWEKGEFPQQWSEGIINPILKKGDPLIPDNFRKITIMNEYQSFLKLF